MTRAIRRITRVSALGVAVLLSVLCAPSRSEAESFEELRSRNWHQWRGPEANGVSRTATPPTEWSEERNVRWKVAVDGRGSSTPIVWENRVFLLTAIDTGKVDPSLPRPEDQPKRVFGITYPNTEYEFVVLCLDRASGEEFWRRTATRNIPHEGHHGDNDYASASPTTDGERLYCWFGSAGLFCYDLAGTRLWERNLGKAFMEASLGEGCSPVVHDGQVIVVRDQKGPSSIEVIDARTGDTRWRADREEPGAWATPLVVGHAGRTQVITSASNRVRSYDLDSGDVIWQCGGLTGNVIPSPVVEDGIVFCMSGYQGYALLALPISASGDITDTDAIVWRKSRGTPYIPSPLLYDGWLYFLQSNRAILSCVDARTGESIVERTRLPDISNVYASPVGADGRVYVTGRDGTTLVLERARQLKVLATNELDDPINASAALAGGQLFLRGRKFLYCIEETGRGGSPSDEAAFEVVPGERQLFLDDVGIERTERVRRVVHPPTRHPANPVLRPDTHWERGCQVYGTALYDEAAGRFRMWYLTGPRDRGLRPLELDGRERAPHTTLAAYAESEDGVHWVKPKLGLFPYDGDTQNNLLGLGRYNCEGISVLHDPRDPDPTRRWKCVYWDHGSGGWEVRDGKPFCKAGPEDGWYVAFSPDGIRWTPHAGNPVIARYCDTNQNVVYDPRLEKYVGFSRFGFGRRLARSESDDFLTWSEPKLVLECDEADGPGTQIYGAGVDIYEGVYIAMLWIYREGGDGKIDTQLATSRDGVRWTRVGDRATWLALGDDEGWEGGMVRSVERIISRGDELFIYYCGVHGAHSGPKFKKVVRKHPVQIGLLTQRRDGFVSLSAGKERGTVVTRKFRQTGGELLVNADASRGELRVEVLDADGRVVARSTALRGDLPRERVTWKKGGIAGAKGTAVQLRFTLREARLYSYWVQ